MIFLLIVVSLVFFIISFWSVTVGIVILVLSMLFSPEIQVGTVGVRDIAIRFEDLLIPLIFLALVARVATRRETTLFQWSPINKPIGLLILLSIISTVWGSVTGWVEPVTGFFYFAKLLQFFVIFFLVVSFVRTESQIKLFLFFSLLTVCFLGFYTLFQVPQTEMFTEHRITAPFEGGKAQPATVGGYMAFLLLIILSIFLFEKDTKMKLLYGVLGGIVLIPFTFTFNRTSYAALYLGLIFIAFSIKKKWFTVLLICLSLTAPFWAPQSVKDRIAYTWEDAKNPGRVLGVDMSFTERIYSFQRAWFGFKQSPLIGLGITSFNYPDNQYARTLHEGGILGLFLWLWIFFRLFKVGGWLFNTVDSGLLKGMALGYQAGILGILMHGFGACTFYIVRIMEPFWFISGLIVSLYLIQMNQKPVANS